MPELVLRPAAAGDFVSRCDLYNRHVCESPVTFDTEAFTPEARRPWLESFFGRGRHRLVVGECGQRSLGYACLGTRPCRHLFDRLAGEDVHRAVAGITLPNLASVALHRRLGFAPVGVFEQVGYKFGRYWDVQWWQRAVR